MRYCMRIFQRSTLSFILRVHRAMSNSSSDEILSELVRSIVPTLATHLHKGQCGRIGVIGGCQQYTGAPYFAAISALKVGADLSYVFCTQDAAPVIKSYSPELIVYPVLDDNDAVSKISEVLPRLDCVVIGPGLGRDERLLQNVSGVIENAVKLQLPLVIDADGVFLLCKEPNLISGHTKAVLTPNIVEFARIYSAVTKNKSCNELGEVQELSRALGNVTIVKKGEKDIIANAYNTLTCSVEGSLRRCGGQGDLLAGSLGTLNYWAHTAAAGQLVSNSQLTQYGPTVSAAYAACLLTRHCAKKAFERNRRSTTTSDLIARIGEVFDEHFES